MDTPPLPLPARGRENFRFRLAAGTDRRSGPHAHRDYEGLAATWRNAQEWTPPPLPLPARGRENFAAHWDHEGLAAVWQNSQEWTPPLPLPARGRENCACASGPSRPSRPSCGTLRNGHPSPSPPRTHGGGRIATPRKGVENYYFPLGRGRIISLDFLARDPDRLDLEHDALLVWLQRPERLPCVAPRQPVDVLLSSHRARLDQPPIDADPAVRVVPIEH